MADASHLQEILARNGLDLTGPEPLVLGAREPAWRFDVAGDAAIETWSRIRALTEELGHYPVVGRDPHGTLLDPTERLAPSAAEILKRAESQDVVQWFRARLEADRELYSGVDVGEWVEAAPQSGWTVPLDDSMKRPASDVWILLLPTTRPWEAFAHLGLGGWNECPEAADHVALHRYWFETYGAEPVCVSSDVLEMRVTRPPGEREWAEALAREQFLYTGGDLVYQGHETLNRLASSLVDAGYWYFWWD